MTEEVFIAGVWWKNKQEYDRIVRLEINKLDKNDYNYAKQLECVRALYSVRKRDLPKYLI